MSALDVVVEKIKELEKKVNRDYAIYQELIKKKEDNTITNEEYEKLRRAINRYNKNVRELDIEKRTKKFIEEGGINSLR